MDVAIPLLPLEQEYIARVTLPPGGPDNDLQYYDLFRAKQIWKVLHVSAALALKKWHGGVMPTVSPSDREYLLVLADAVFTGRVLPPDLSPLEHHLVREMRFWVGVFHAHWRRGKGEEERVCVEGWMDDVDWMETYA